MAEGRLGVAKSINGQWVEVCKITEGARFASVVVHLTNSGPTPAKVIVGMSFDNTPSDAELVETGVQLAPNGGSEERGCFTMSANERLFIKVDSDNVSVRADGLEQL